MDDLRFKLEEIEAALGRDEGVAQAGVVTLEDRLGNRDLVAYVVPAAGHSLDRQLLHQYMAEQMPAYMLPAAIVVLEALPFEPNGELDLKALCRSQIARLTT